MPPREKRVMCTGGCSQLFTSAAKQAEHYRWRHSGAKGPPRRKKGTARLMVQCPHCSVTVAAKGLFAHHTRMHQDVPWGGVPEETTPKYAPPPLTEHEAPAPPALTLSVLVDEKGSVRLVLDAPLEALMAAFKGWLK